jgi:hypothetical protein|tara:strand:- start:32072 stop:32446 length:375 start_codon:yes stop_codon:yes gene_type:complete
MKKFNSSNKKQRGFILTSEAVLLSTVMVVGMTTGLVTLRDSMNAELEDVAEAIGSLDQSYSFNGIENEQNSAGVAGSAFGDAIDTIAGDGVTWSYTAVDLLEGDATVAAASAGAASASAAAVRP